MPSNTAPRRSDVDRRAINRRTLVAIGASSGFAALAGCSEIIEAVANLGLKELNVFNEAGQSISGTVEVTDPNGAVVLNDQFDLVSHEAAGDEDDGDKAFFEDVLTDAGAYTLSVSLADGSTVAGANAAEETVDVSTPDDEHLVALLGPDEAEEPIVITAIEELSALGEYHSEY